jgi:hypothetical protein
VFHAVLPEIYPRIYSSATHGKDKKRAEERDICYTVRLPGGTSAIATGTYKQLYRELNDCSRTSNTNSVTMTCHTFILIDLEVDFANSSSCIAGMLGTHVCE